jgi:hypothetical protein
MTSSSARSRSSSVASAGSAFDVLEGVGALDDLLEFGRLAVRRRAAG